MTTKALVTQKQDHPMTVIARNPGEMKVAQQHLILWADQKVEYIEQELVDLEQNLAMARKYHWRRGPWTARINKAKRKIEFYRKVKAALEAGYCIVPNFPVDVFAVRTTKAKPKRGKEKWAHNLPTPETNSPPVGEGQYVSTDTIVEKSEVKKVDNREVVLWSNKDFDLVDFPFAFAKPEILDDTGKAMARKIFDDIGALPPRKRRGDPVVVGRIVMKEGYNEKCVTFLISWFIDTDQL